MAPEPLSDAADRALYAIGGRSILRVGGIPAPPPFEPAQTFGLLEFAAIVEA